ncbi:MAG TPA: hypothetical protein VED63_08950 [Acidimicrobiales bacterium]|nr:hypothetical protein [Acidimicrobiales bacterium]
MSTNRDHLIHTIDELIGCSTLLRATLSRYERAMAKIAKQLERGEPGITAARGSGIPAQRRQVTEAIEEFESARHQLRLALFVVGQEEGASISEVGRVLGISRQLSSRLAAEAAGRASDPE